ncbi:MAG: hypothetical protein LBG06_05960, partial [Deltaproteobacteria bacterium]|jgi:hypothetical protein|nr:hypothetical protein [Deltaproteobacteria bacterium]
MAPSLKAPYGKAPYVKAPYGKAPYGKAPYGKAPYGKAPYGKAPYGEGAAGSIRGLSNEALDAALDREIPFAVERLMESEMVLSEAAEAVLDLAEGLQQATASLKGHPTLSERANLTVRTLLEQHSAAIEDIVTVLFERCSFHDLCSQRLRKVRDTLLGLGELMRNLKVARESRPRFADRGERSGHADRTAIADKPDLREWARPADTPGPKGKPAHKATSARGALTEAFDEGMTEAFGVAGSFGSATVVEEFAEREAADDTGVLEADKAIEDTGILKEPVSSEGLGKAERLEGTEGHPAGGAQETEEAIEDDEAVAGDEGLLEDTEGHPTGGAQETEGALEDDEAVMGEEGLEDSEELDDDGDLEDDDGDLEDDEGDLEDDEGFEDDDMPGGHEHNGDQYANEEDSRARTVGGWDAPKNKAFRGQGATEGKFRKNQGFQGKGAAGGPYKNQGFQGKGAAADRPYKGQGFQGKGFAGERPYKGQGFQGKGFAGERPNQDQGYRWKGAADGRPYVGQRHHDQPYGGKGAPDGRPFRARDFQERDPKGKPFMGKDGPAAGPAKGKPYAKKGAAYDAPQAARAPKPPRPGTRETSFKSLAGPSAGGLSQADIERLLDELTKGD